MIFLITASARAEECAAALERAISERVSVVAELHSGDPGSANDHTILNGARAIVIDEAFLDLWPGVEDEVLSPAGDPPAIFVNMAISGISRIVQQVRHALHRNDRQQLNAVVTAEAMLRSELSGTLTGILLNAQLALRDPALPEDAATKMREVHSLALELKGRLQHHDHASPPNKIHAKMAGKNV